MKKVLIAQKTPPEVIGLLKDVSHIITLEEEGNVDELKKKLGDVIAVLLGSSIKFTKDL